MDVAGATKFPLPLDEPFQARGDVSYLQVLVGHLGQHLGVASQGPPVADYIFG